MLARRLVQTRVPTELQYLSYLSLRSPSRSHHLILPSPSTGSLRSRPNIPSSSPAPPTALSYGLQKRYFHPTPKREGLPVIWSLLAVLKSSTMIAAVTAISRVALSIIPLQAFRLMRSARRLRAFTDPASTHPYFKPPNVSPTALLLHGPPLQPLPPDASDSLKAEMENLAEWEKTKSKYVKRKISTRRWLIALLLTPFALLGLSIGAGLERVPLTGRLRVILISPEEEKAIHETLKELGWFTAVSNLLLPSPPSSSSELPSPPPTVLDTKDWRWNWVESTLRRLERGIEPCCRSEQGDKAAEQAQLEASSPFPFPPPPPYPLHSRPRASQRLHHHLLCAAHPQEAALDDLANLSPHHPVLIAKSIPSPATIEGPPFSLLIIESCEQNAFSYGFGGNGAAGIVIFTGMLDAILRNNQTPSSDTPSLFSSPPQPKQQRSILSYFFPSLSSSSQSLAASSSSAQTTPTEEQTLHLATILSHEMSHLLLSHHLETLTWTSILLPSVMSLAMDLVRTALFPITMIFGPFVNDVIANFSRSSSVGIDHIGSVCASKNRLLEIEADLVGLRLLAHARFSPFVAQQFYSPSHSPVASAVQPLPPSPSSSFPSSPSSPTISSPLPQPATITPSNAIPRPNSAFGQHFGERTAWKAHVDANKEGGLAARGRSETHPDDAVRAEAVRKELESWERAWKKRVEEKEMKQKTG